jgi:hypothetical protein
VPIISAMTLEAYVEPTILSEDRLHSFLVRIFDVILFPSKTTHL